VTADIYSIVKTTFAKQVFVENPLSGIYPIFTLLERLPFSFPTIQNATWSLEVNEASIFLKTLMPDSGALGFCLYLNALNQGCAK
jgi:hypothetical protein